MKAICIALVILFSAIADSQSPGTPSQLTARGAFFALVVADIQASSKWYQDTLGMKTVLPLSREGKVAVTALEGNGLIVELIQNDDARPRPAKDEPIVHGMFKAGVIVEDFEKTVALLRARQVEIVAGPFPKKPGARANILVKDNAGNLIQFFGE